MEIQLKELIEQIKRDGVETAEAEAAEILEKANAEAEKIVLDAKAEAEKILLKAKDENKRMVRVSEDSIRQAGRNLLISFRESVGKELKAIIDDKVEAVYSSDALSSLIVKIVENWAENTDADDISVILSDKDAASLEEALLAALKERMLSGVTLKANDSFDVGFRIAVNNGTAYYDYSKDEVTDMLSNYLSPKVTALMKEAEEV